MKKLLFVLSMLLFTGLAGQNLMVFTFSGSDLGNHVPLDSIYVKNLSQGCDTLVTAPDTTLSFLITGIQEATGSKNGIVLQQNYPNPFIHETFFNVVLKKEGTVKMQIVDLRGTELLTFQRMLPAGTHRFKYVPGKTKVSFLRVTAHDNSAAIKMLAAGASASQAELTYLGASSTPSFKRAGLVSGFVFGPGDQLLVVGYAPPGGSGMVVNPQASSDYTLEFATNTPCLGMDSLLYEGQWYQTIQVFNQCWFKENLNAGTMVVSAQGQSNNNTIEKYCMGDIATYCNEYGGMYTWDEMMQYSTLTQQGICPEGWHIPNDLDWKILEGAVDTQWGIGDPIWDLTDWRGFDAGANLKEAGTQHWWAGNTGTDLFGFTALPGGYYVQNSFWGIEYRAVFWSSDNPAYTNRILDAPESGVRRVTGTNPGNEAFSVRCIKDI